MEWLKELFNFTLPIIDKVPIIREVLGFIIVFFLPGFAWTFIFPKQINHIERVALSFGLSIALVTLSVLFSNMILNIRITGLNSLITITIITIIPIAIYYGNKYFQTKKT